MKVYNLLSENNWAEVKECFLILYPDQIKNINGYIKVFTELVSTIPVFDDMVIDIYHVDADEEFDIKAYESLYGYYIHDTSNERYAIELTDWATILGMSLDDTLLERYSICEVIAHLLFEITFYGYTSKAVEQESDRINEMVREVKEQIAKEYN